MMKPGMTTLSGNCSGEVGPIRDMATKSSKSRGLVWASMNLRIGAAAASIASWLPISPATYG